MAPIASDNAWADTPSKPIMSSAPYPRVPVLEPMRAHAVRALMMRGLMLRALILHEVALGELMACAPTPARTWAGGRGTSPRPCLPPTRLRPGSAARPAGCAHAEPGHGPPLLPLRRQARATSTPRSRPAPRL